MGRPRRETIRQRSPALLIALLGALVCGTGSQRADWTVIVVLSGAYVDTLGRFESVGSSDRVNVVVLHDTGASTSAYRILPDKDLSHPPGECCPAGGTCCDREMLALAELGLTEESRVSEETLDKYFSYVQNRFPARHYLITMRGHASESALSINWGGGRVTVPQLATLLAHFSERRGGEKLEVLNLGMCQTASTDWAYEFAPFVGTFVGSANFTNPPVAMRWRMHLWVGELLRNPTLSGRELAAKMVQLFADTWDYCLEAGHLCSNASRGEPWTVAAVDLSAMEDVATAARNLVCEASLLEDGSPVRRAAGAATQYGWPGWTRSDFAQFATNLEREVPGTPLAERALALREAVGRAVLAHASEPGTYPSEALGLAGAFLQSNATAAQVGPFQVRSLWRPFLSLCDGSGFPDASDVRLSPPRAELRVGERVEVEARGFLPEYGEMCRLPGRWALSPGAPLSLDSPTGNPAILNGLSPGSCQLSFRGRTVSAAEEVVVRSATEPLPEPGDGGSSVPTGVGLPLGGAPFASLTVSSGCSSAAGPAGLSLALGWSLFALARRRRRPS
jgi:hypothetical protein